MSGSFDFDAGFEPERYELDAAPMYRPLLGRRDFFKLIGGGVVVCCLVHSAEAQESGGGRRRGGGRALPQELGSWLHIAEDGQVTVYTGKAEVGQNIRTSLTQVVAEELRAPLDSIRLVMGDTELTPFDAGTFGSRTTPDMARQLRRVGAAAREVLLDLAAAELKAERTALVVADGTVRHRDKPEGVPFGKLTRGQKLTAAVSDDARLMPATQWKIAGTSVPKVNARAFVTGEHRYASDVIVPGLKHGKILRPPSAGATLESVDTKEAEALPGVTVVHEGSFVGVVAATDLAATRALKLIKAGWKSTPQIGAKDLFAHLKRSTSEGGGGRGSQRVGSIKDGLEAADFRLEQTYTVAYIAHAPLEPRAAVAEWKDGKATVWTGTQRPFGARGEVAGALGVPEDKVRVIVPDTGSGYGGKHTGEAAVEAARLSKASGHSVKVVWTREEEFAWAYFRPAGVIEVKSGVRKDGTLTAWEFHNYNSGASAIRPLYEVPNQVIEFHSSQSPLRQGSYRALAATANHFARETHMDELAHSAGLDPLEFRLKNLKDARLRAVLEAAAAKFGWGKTKPADGHGFGLAGGSEKNSYVATCAEVSVDKGSGRVQVLRAVSAFECGAVLNPDHLKNQIEGAMVMGLGGALFEAIEFEDGRITNGRFSDYRVPRFSDTPQIDVVLLDRKDAPSDGAGETPIVAIAPAIGNAIFAATGVRRRSMPLTA